MKNKHDIYHKEGLGLSFAVDNDNKELGNDEN